MSDNPFWKDLSVSYQTSASAQITTQRSAVVGVHIAPGSGSEESQVSFFDYDGTGSAPTTLAASNFTFNTGDSGQNMPLGGIWMPIPSGTSILFEDGIFVRLNGAASDYASVQSITLFYTT